MKPGGDDSAQPLNTTPVVSKEGLVPMGDQISNWVPSAEQPFKADTVYFEYDKATIKSSETHKLFV